MHFLYFYDTFTLHMFRLWSSHNQGYTSRFTSLALVHLILSLIITMFLVFVASVHNHNKTLATTGRGCQHPIKNHLPAISSIFNNFNNFNVLTTTNEILFYKLQPAVLYIECLTQDEHNLHLKVNKSYKNIVMTCENTK
jgi:hypothetical protein